MLIFDDKKVNIEQQIVQKVRQLSISKQQELLNFAKSLQAQETSQPKLDSIKGLCSELDIDLEFEEFEQARREVWTKFAENV